MADMETSDNPVGDEAPKQERPKKEEFSRDEFAGGSPLEQMILALSDEIDFADRNAKKQTLKDGGCSGELGGLYLYTFPIHHAFDFEPDEDVAVAIGGRDYRGRIVKVDLGAVVIGIEEDHGKIIHRVDVTKAENVIEKLLRKQLIDVFKGKAGFKKDQAGFAIGIGAPKVTTSPMPNLVDEFLSAPGKGFSLNSGQEAFLTNGLESEFTLLWGPPGCGKTMSIGLLAACFLEQGKKVLLASNTNKAVDGAIEAVLETLSTTNRLEDEETFVRFGGAGVTEEFRARWPDHLFENILRDQGQELEAEQLELEGEQSRLAGQLAQCEQGLSEFSEHRSAEKRLDSLPREIRDAERQLGNLRDQLQALNIRQQELEAEWVNAPEETSLTTRLIGRRDRETIEKELADCQGQQTEVSEASDRLGQKLGELKSENEHLIKRIDDLKARLRDHPPEAELEKQQPRLRSELAKIDARLLEIEKSLADLVRSILSNATLVATTVHKTFLDPVLSETEFDVVIVDEASMVVLPMIYWAAGRSKRQVVVVGDFRQLPAIVKNTDSDLVSEWAGCSPFDKWQVRDAIRDDRASSLPFLIALQEQNRMHPEIGKLVSDLFYMDIRSALGVGLLPGPRALEQVESSVRLPWQEMDKRIFTIDTKNLGAWSSKPFGGTGRFNPTHVALGLSLIDRLIAAGVLEKGKENQIGFVTPYAGQAQLFQEATRDRHPGYIDATSIGTAHRFQGGERDIMIFDYVLSECRTYPSRFIDAQTSEDQPANLLNVALSRAKTHLIIIFNSEEFGEKNTHPWMRRFFETLSGRAKALNAQELLDESNILGKVRELASAPFSLVDFSQTAHKETTFYSAVREDLDAAKHSVTIFSAFATPENLGRWLDLFKSLLERNVKVRIVTKPVSKQPKPKTYGPQLQAMFNALRKAGIVLDTRVSTHEKVVIIDERIVWHGSLNMLSQNRDRTTEFMTRSVSEEFAQEVMRMLSRHDLKQKDPFLPQLPDCPTCGGPTVLSVNWKGTHSSLWCEQDCGFIVGDWEFHKLVRRIPLGRHLHACSECANGTIVYVQDRRGKSFGQCSNAKAKNGKKCDYREEVRLSDLEPYEPYPEPTPPNPSHLTKFISEASSSVASGLAAVETFGSQAEDAKPEERKGKGRQKRQLKGKQKLAKLTAKAKPSSKTPSSKPKRKTVLTNEDELDAYLSSLG